MNFPENLKYTADSEWVKVEGNIAIVGITDFAQKELGDMVFVEVETVGDTLSVGESFGTIEAVKTVAELLMPVAGEVLEFNADIEDNPAAINSDPYGCWIVKIKMQDASEAEGLMDVAAYKSHIGV